MEARRIFGIPGKDTSGLGLATLGGGIQSEKERFRQATSQISL